MKNTKLIKDTEYIITQGSIDKENPNHIDDIFVRIRSLYSSHELSILYHSLILVEKTPEHYETYIEGINILFITNL